MGNQIRLIKCESRTIPCNKNVFFSWKFSVEHWVTLNTQNERCKGLNQQGRDGRRLKQAVWRKLLIGLMSEWHFHTINVNTCIALDCLCSSTHINTRVLQKMLGCWTSENGLNNQMAFGKIKYSNNTFNLAWIYLEACFLLFKKLEEL